MKRPNPAACVSFSWRLLKNHAMEKSARIAVKIIPIQADQEGLIWFLFIQLDIPHKAKTTNAPKKKVNILI